MVNITSFLISLAGAARRHLHRIGEVILAATLLAACSSSENAEEIAPVQSWDVKHYEPAAMGGVEFPSTVEEVPFLGESSVLLLHKARSPDTNPKWVLDWGDGCSFALKPPGGSTDVIGASSALATITDSPCDPSETPEYGLIDHVTISGLSDEGKATLVLMDGDNVVASGLLYSFAHIPDGEPASTGATSATQATETLITKAADRSEKAADQGKDAPPVGGLSGLPPLSTVIGQNRSPAPPAIQPLQSVDAMFVVQPSGISRLNVVRRQPSGEQIEMVLLAASSGIDVRPGERFAVGHFVPTSQRLLTQEILQAVSRACGRTTLAPQIAERIVPVRDVDGRARTGIYRLENVQGNPRVCKVGEFSTRTCEMISCVKWSDHPDFSGENTGFYLVRSMADARSIYAGLTKWTGSAYGTAPANRSGSSADQRDYAAEASRRAVEDYMVDLWLEPSRGY